MYRILQNSLQSVHADMSVMRFESPEFCQSHDQKIRKRRSSGQPIDLWGVGCFESSAHVHCWIVGHLVSKQWRFITDETDSCFVCWHEWYFFCKSYMRYSYFSELLLMSGVNYHHRLLWDFVHDNIASVWVRHYPACNNQVLFAY